MNTVTTRRNLVAGTMGASVAALSAAAVARAEEAAVPTDGYETRYDLDILVVGGGIAGLCAAIRAIELGEDPQRVLVIDKMSGEGADYGGSSLIMSGNYLLASDPSDEGVQAFADAMYDICGKTQDYDLLTTLAQHANETLDWMIGLGAGYGDANATAYDAAVTRSMASDARAVPALMDAYGQKGGQLVFGVKAWRLNMGPSGVCGVLASDAEGYFNIAAKKVVLATGGFLSNPGMLEEYIGDNAGLITPRTPWSITGDGITMVKEVGGTMAGRSHGVKACYLSCTSADNLTQAHSSRALGLSIAVNLNGQRYANEADSGQDTLRALVDQPNCTMGMISDSKRLDELESVIENYANMNVPAYTFETLDEVAEFIGCPVENLQATVDEYNAHVVDDHTEGLVVDKTSGAATIDTPPYYVFYPFKLTSSFLGAGVRTDGQARVVGADGLPIPNLYAAGEIQGGFAYDEYFHGANNTKAAVFGRIAGEEAYGALA